MPAGARLLQGAGHGIGVSLRGCWQPPYCCCWWPPWLWGLAVSRNRGYGVGGSWGGGTGIRFGAGGEGWAAGGFCQGWGCLGLVVLGLAAASPCLPLRPSSVPLPPSASHSLSIAMCCLPVPCRCLSLPSR